MHEKNIKAKDVLIIFLKYPEPGSVKTRLAKTIGDDKAASLYSVFTQKIFKDTANIAYRRMIFFTPEEKLDSLKKWLKADVIFYPQRGKSLGDRLVRAFETAFKEGARRVIAIGTDSPLIDHKIILKAFNALSGKEAVIGPTEDGGYYLIGLSRPFLRSVFQKIRWGSGEVFRQTLDRMRSGGLRFKILAEERDIDDERSLMALLADIRSKGEIVPADKKLYHNIEDVLKR